MRGNFQALVRLDNNANYLFAILLISQALNFLSGIAFSLYAPSLPAITNLFHTTTTATKNTMTATMVGFAFGSIIFGVLMDYYGRKKSLVPAMLLFIACSLYAPYVASIQALMLVRLLQGIFISAAAIGSRALVVDYFSGKNFVIAILYTTVAYGLGLVLGPFFGGYLQSYFSWQGNFYAYAMVGLFITIYLLLFINESLVQQEPQQGWNVFKFYYSIVTHKTFLAGSAILGIVMIQQLIYPTVGVFLMQYKLGYTPLLYGYTALAVGLSYLAGTLSNRYLLKYFTVKDLIDIGLKLVALSVLAQIILACSTEMNVWTLLLPIVAINFGLGFMFGNILGLCLQLFPKNAGMNMAVQSCFLMLASSLGIFIISYLTVSSLFILAMIFLMTLIIQGILYYSIFRPNINM